MGCDYYIDPFACLVDENATGVCGLEPAMEVTFRRIADGVVGKSFRCGAHAVLCNDKWELVALPMGCQDGPSIYECWESADGTEISFGNPITVLTEHDVVIGLYARYSVRARSWNEAVQAHYDIQGLGTYKPM